MPAGSRDRGSVDHAMFRTLRGERGSDEQEARGRYVAAHSFHHAKLAPGLELTSHPALGTMPRGATRACEERLMRNLIFAAIGFGSAGCAGAAAKADTATARDSTVV